MYRSELIVVSFELSADESGGSPIWLTLRCSSLGLGEPFQTVKFGHENISLSEFGVKGVTGASDGSNDGTDAADEEDEPSDDPVDMRLLRLGMAFAYIPLPTSRLKFRWLGRPEMGKRESFDDVLRGGSGGADLAKSRPENFGLRIGVLGSGATGIS